MPRAKKEKVPVRTFVIGRDFTEDQVQLMVLKIAKWFASPDCDRRHEDPEAAAKEIVEQCLNATTKTGEVWGKAPADFNTRIRVKAAYDLATDTGIKINPLKHPDAKRRLEPGVEDNGKKLGEMRPSIFDFDVVTYRAEEEAKLLAQYPELNNTVYLPHVRRVTLLYAQQEMLDRELLNTTSAAKRESTLRQIETLNKTLDSTLKILDIHPESLRKKLKESEDGTLGDLVQVLDSDDEFPAIERLWADQLALMLWYMTVHSNGRGDGPQITEWEMWHMTRSLPIAFTCSCGRHYPALVRGFTPKQLKAHLLARGILVQKSPIPTLIPDAAFSGMSDYIDALEGP
jgi:hypothetical protein